MDRLTESAPFPLTTFNRCQLCGKEDDICSFEMLYECDEKDAPEKERIFICCRKGPCHDRIVAHPRMYRTVIWGKGGPGKFMLLCGDCDKRKGTKCTSSLLKENGGVGLCVKFVKPPFQGTFCTDTGCHDLGVHFSPAISCEDHPTKKE